MVQKPEKIKFQHPFTERWITEEVVEVEDLRPRYDIIRFVTSGGHRVRRENCIESIEEV